MLSSPSTTCAPSFRSSVAIAASRSVSFTRQFAMLRIRVVPSANSASTATVIAASGIAFRSRSTPRKSRRTHFDEVVVHVNVRAHRAQYVDEGDVALRAVTTDAAHLHRAAANRAGREKVRC